MKQKGFISVKSGFTLIELLVVISVMAILSSGALAAYKNYSNAQILQSAANEFYDTLQSAKTEAQSQVKPSGCTGFLNNYNVAYGGSAYSLNALCDTTQTIKTVTLPTGFSFKSNGSISFNVLTGGLTLSTLPPASITITSNIGSKKIITVTANGQISISN